MIRVVVPLLLSAATQLSSAQLSAEYVLLLVSTSFLSGVLGLSFTCEGRAACCALDNSFYTTQEGARASWMLSLVFELLQGGAPCAETPSSERLGRGPLGGRA